MDDTIGFGFVVRDDQQEFFYHRSALAPELNDLEQGARIAFDVVNFKGRLRAVRLCPNIS